jgi:hypothetical protein
MTWGTLLRPTIIVVYQAKNDVTPYYNAAAAVPNLFPDLSNAMMQVASADGWRSGRGVAALWRKLRYGHSGGLRMIYGSEPPPPGGLGRFGETELALTEMRYHLFGDIATQLSARLVFMPEIVLEGPYHGPVRQLNAAARRVAAARGVEFFDIEQAMPNDPRLFQDKMHFTAEGCLTFAELVARYLARLLRC